MPSGGLRVDKYNPKDQHSLTLSHRIRQILYTHQGRDKVFKCIQYLLRLLLWIRGVEAQHFTREEKHKNIHKFSLLERNLMTIINGRRLFRLGRSISEMVRVRVTILKCSELLLQPTLNPYMVMFLESQMVVDILARLLFSIKLTSDDIGYLARKGFLHESIEQRMTEFGRLFALPVILFDLYLNTTRLVQGLMDARYDAAEVAQPPPAPNTPVDKTHDSPKRTKSAFSLLSQYDSMNKMRRSVSPKPASSDRLDHVTTFSSPNESESSGGEDNTTRTKPNTPPPSKACPAANGAVQQDTAEFIVVNSYLELLWNDYSLYWVCLTQVKILCDLLTSLSITYQWNHAKTGGLVSACGLVSGLLSVHRVWVYGR